MSRQQRIERIVTQALPINHISIENESHTHQVPAGAESHFKMTIVSERFEGISPITRHRQIYALLKNEFDTGLHALSLFLYTQDEWAKKNHVSPSSPPCQRKINQSE